MFNKFYKTIAATAVASIALTAVVAAPVGAQSLSPSGPNEAVAPSSDWVGIEPGESQWYTFHYDFDEDDSASQAIVELEMAVEDSLRFEIWTSEQLRQWSNGDEVDALGAGSVSSNDDMILEWAGSAPASDTYYVIVENNRSIPSYYSLDITGEDVSFTTASFDDMMSSVVNEEASVATDLADIQTETMALTVETGFAQDNRVGSDPANAMIPNSEWTELQPGESRWYTFDYDYDNSDDALPTEALVELEMGAENTVEFEIWTPDRLQQSATDEDIEALGVGSVKSDLTGNDDHDTKLIWSGSAPASDTYYIVVQNKTDQPAYYSLNVSGDDVTF